MMDKLQEKSLAHFAMLAGSDIDDAALAWRHSKDLGKEPIIWADIVRKLRPSKGSRILDIGCGCGGVTLHALFAAQEIGMDMHLLDIPEVVRRLKSNVGNAMDGVKAHCGIFPEGAPPSVMQTRYDMILAYSVLQYTERPRDFVMAALALLAPGGRALFGDLPNINKKGRFLASDAGRAFEADYRGVPLDQVEKFRDHKDFAVRSEGQNKLINDELVSGLVAELRSMGMHAYVLPQDDGLPFSRTREDLLVERP